MARQPYNVTFEVTQLDDGRIRAQYGVRHRYEDSMGAQTLDMSYTGEFIWDAGDTDTIWEDAESALFDPRRLDRSLVRFARGHFDVVPRPLTVRVAYEVEGIEPAERGYRVDDYLPEEDEGDVGEESDEGEER